METEQARQRRQQRIEELCAASIRALSGEPDLHFRGGRLYRGEHRLPAYAPHLHPSIERDPFVAFRGAADGLALRVRHSDASLHAAHTPADATAASLFSLLEQIRVESLADAQMPGLQRNLLHRFDTWSQAFHDSGLTETLSGLIVYTLVQVAHARVHGRRVLEDTEDLIETTRGKLVTRIGHDLAALRRARKDQAAYALHACAIAEQIAALLRDLAASEANTDDEGSARSGRFDFSLWTEPDSELEVSTTIASTERSRAFDEAGGDYRVFNTAYDRELQAASLVRPEQLRNYREQLDARITERGLNVARLARQWKALLSTPTVDGWDGAQEEGRIDGSRLAQLIASPAERRLFRADRVEPVAHAAVSFLLDCSGSMKQHIEPISMLVDVTARALEAAGVVTEVLGFSTGAWNGGRAARDWQRAGRPRHPGRLNERLHLVFKDADAAWRRARPGIAALWKPDLYREGFDGEAVDWACGRLMALPQQRRILFVVSDGCPMDSATQRANDATYLDHHLLQVVRRHEQAGQVEVLGLGVGLDLSLFYRRCQAIDLSQGLSAELLQELLELVRGLRQR
ncbi:MAG: cobalt chelatase [Rubrivivax sp.]|nr:cobalt chelatase [Rubrivivax sp.]